MGAAPSRRGGAHGYPRVARVNEVLREVVADALERMSDTDDDVGLLTVTGVECTSDLRAATVFLSSLTEPVAEALEDRRAELQHEVARQVRMKRTPKLSFVADPAVAHGAAVDETLRRLAQPEP